MSEEIALASAPDPPAGAGDRAHIERLQEGINHWKLQAEDATAALRAVEERIATESNEIRALLIEMRRYFISHNCPTGECVAWNELKRRFNVGQRDADDEAWMTAHIGQPFTLRRSSDERKRRNRE